jgi:ribose 5-phosphate isomerase B
MENEREKEKETIIIGSDHAGFKIKEHLRIYLESLNKYEVIDVGTKSEDSVDFPKYAEALCIEVLKNPSYKGIVVCGSGIGVSITCNKIPGIYCALVHDYWTAMMCRKHNDCNVIAMGQNSVGEKLAENIVDAFLSHEFITSEDKYKRRKDMITAIEEKYLKKTD